MSGTNPYVLNIVELQNVQTSVTGLTDVGQFGTVVDVPTREVRVNAVRAFDTPGTAMTLTGTEATLSNTYGTAVDLRVYGNVYASNYLSLCPLRFWVGSTTPREAIHVTEEGKVGVGTSTPEALMDIRGDMRCGGNVWIGGPLVIEGDVIIRGRLRVEGGIEEKK